MKKEIRIVKDGPYEVSGLPLSEGIIKCDNEGYPLTVEKTKDYPKQNAYRLCRCGESSNKPFCDGTHLKIKFKGSETAEKEEFGRMKDIVEGQELILEDIVPLCSESGFCYGREGNTWDLIRSADRKSNEVGVRQACNCVSGRLVAIDKRTNRPIEPEFNPSIMVLKEPWKNVGSSIWVRGNVPIVSANGREYEVRNRVALCRCGKSSLKPFCDATHRYINFKG